MSAIENFLAEYRRRHWGNATLPSGIVAEGVYTPDAGGPQIEISYATASDRPLRVELRKAWRDRHAARATGLLMVVAYPAPHEPRAAVVGLHDDGRTADVSLALAERLAVAALEADSTRAAEELLAELFADDESAVAGLRNAGLFATHELLANAPRRSDWKASSSQASGLRRTAGEDLLRALGWAVEHKGSDLILRGPDTDRERAVAVLLEGDEVFDRPSQRYGSGLSPVEHALGVARHHEVTWVVAVQGTKARLYSADPDVGMARTGSASFTELRVDLLDDDSLAYAWLILSPAALAPGGSVAELLQGSRDHATDLGGRLRDRIYVDVVPSLAETVANGLGDVSEHGLERAYHDTLVILFRILFVAYAEDRALLPYRRNASYTRVALKSRAIDYARRLERDDDDFDENSTATWDGLTAIWDGVFRGHTEWGIPEYGGGLFDPESGASRDVSRLRLTNAQIGPALRAMIVDIGADGTRGPVDFQALSVREFGTIYEGLLESSLSLAATDLTVDAKSLAYVPAKAGDHVAVRAHSVYFHNASGARKATGSYFTKAFAVEHLLQTALDPTVNEHLERIRTLLDAGKHADAALRFFQFSVADLAMGSGHFLVSAVDHVAAALNAFLAERPIAGVAEELERLRAAAVSQLERAGVPTSQMPEITHEALLRRQVAKRCIYGVDINQIAVDLARLGLWIHTFVPGLPMSSLDHGLICGNSLTGIGTVDEALDLLEPGRSARGATSFFYDEMRDGLSASAAPLARAARLAEVSAEEIGEARGLRAEADGLVADTRAALDAALAGRLGHVDLRLVTAQGWDAVVAAGRRPGVQHLISTLRSVHFPVAFPEVFRPGLERPGFDVVLGNPPWEKVHVEKHQWWGLRLPGVRSLGAAKMDAAIEELRSRRPDLDAEFHREIESNDALRALLQSGPYPGIGSGHIDLYKVFCWRDWALLVDGGRAGVVFPRGALSGSGTAAWREEILDAGAFDDVCFLTNTRQWIFDEVHPQYTVALTTIRRGGSKSVTFNGPFHSLAEFEAGRDAVLTVGADEFQTWAARSSFPLLPSNGAATVFRRMRANPRFDAQAQGDFRPVQGDLNATADKALLTFGQQTATSTVPVLAGASFNLWDPDFGDPYATADARKLEAHLQKKRLRQARTSSSAFYGTDAAHASTLPLHRARIAFRDVARSTDTRTVVAALMPPDVAFTHKAPYLFRSASASEADEAYVLGVLTSIPFDWYARRFVEITLSFEILAALPLPVAAPVSSLRLRCAEIAGRLAAVDGRFSSWASAVGVGVGTANGQAVKDDLIAELDAVVGHLYGLSRSDLELIFSTFHRGWDYAPRLGAVLTHYDRWVTTLRDEQEASS